MIGTLLGEWMRIEDGLQNFGKFLEARFSKEGDDGSNKFVRGFSTTSLLFCVGPMMILGSIQDGLIGDYNLLAVKSVLDGFAAMAFASTLGVGVMFSAFVIFVFQGGISLFAGQLNTNIVMSGSVDAAGTSVSFTPIPVTTAPSTTTANVSTTGSTPGGSHTVTFTATDSVTVTAATTATLVVYTAAPSAPALTTPVNGATNVTTTPTFVWSAVSGAATYTLEVDDDSGFGSIDYTANVAGTSHTATSALANETTYYWRVKANNACGASSPSTTFWFTTEQGIGYIYLPLMTNNTTIGSAAPTAAAPTSASPSTALAFVPALLGLVFRPFWRQRR